MKKTLLTLAAGLVMAGTLTSKATVIPIPDGSFEGISSSVKLTTLLSTTNSNFGAWAVSLSGTLNINGTMQCGLSTAIAGPTPPNGAYEVGVNLPVGVGTTATLSQSLTNVSWLPNSTYTLTVGIDQGATANVLAGTSLSLNAGGTGLATLSGTAVANLLNSGSTYQTLTLVYKTGNTVPNNNVGISLVLPSAVSLGGTVYVDNFTLSVVPNQVQLTSAVVSQGGSAKINFNGTGGAPGETFNIITTTNLLTATPTWSNMMTNQFDSNGNFALQIQVNRTTPYRFFRVVLPN